MTNNTYYPPKHATGQYHCPHCGVYAHQKWSHVKAVGDIYSTYGQWGNFIEKSNIGSLTHNTNNLEELWTISFCEHCGAIAIWFGVSMIYPKVLIVSQPNIDLSDDIKTDYLEAAKIFVDSPRSSAALLRLALQKLCKELGEKGDDINTDIKNMVAKGLNPLVQKSLDALRITGNNGVHPGEINLVEEPERVIKLFELLNFIAEKMISEPKEIGSFYDDLPNGAKEAVVKRDTKPTSK